MTKRELEALAEGYRHQVIRAAYAKDCAEAGIDPWTKEQADYEDARIAGMTYLIHLILNCSRSQEAISQYLCQLQEEARQRYKAVYPDGPHGAKLKQINE